MIRVFIIDNHSIFREGLKRVIMGNPDMTVAGEAGDGWEGLRVLREDDYDVVLLDLILPGMGGLEVLRALKACKPELPVLMISIYPEEPFAMQVLKEGASGYLTKESLPGDLIRAIRRAALGGKYVSSTLAEKLVSQIGANHREDPHKRLSSREYQILQMIAAAKSIKEIAWNLKLAPTTVSTYRTRVLEKMNMKSNGELIRYAIEHQLMSHFAVSSASMQ